MNTLFYGTEQNRTHTNYMKKELQKCYGYKYHQNSLNALVRQHVILIVVSQYHILNTET